MSQRYLIFLSTALFVLGGPAWGTDGVSPSVSDSNCETSLQYPFYHSSGLQKDVLFYAVDRFLRKALSVPIERESGHFGSDEEVFLWSQAAEDQSELDRMRKNSYDRIQYLRDRVYAENYHVRGAGLKGSLKDSFASYEPGLPWSGKKHRFPIIRLSTGAILGLVILKMVIPQFPKTGIALGAGVAAMIFAPQFKRALSSDRSLFRDPVSEQQLHSFVREMEEGSWAHFGFNSGSHILPANEEKFVETPLVEVWKAGEERNTGFLRLLRGQVMLALEAFVGDHDVTFDLFIERLRGKRFRVLIAVTGP